MATSTPEEEEEEEEAEQDQEQEQEQEQDSSTGNGVAHQWNASRFGRAREEVIPKHPAALPYTGEEVGTA